MIFFSYFLWSKNGVTRGQSCTFESTMYVINFGPNIYTKRDFFFVYLLKHNSSKIYINVKVLNICKSGTFVCVFVSFFFRWAFLVFFFR